MYDDNKTDRKSRKYELTITRNEQGQFHFASKDFNTLYDMKMYLTHATDVLDMKIRHHEFKSFEDRVIEKFAKIEKKIESNRSTIVDPYSKQPWKSKG